MFQKAIKEAAEYMWPVIYSRRTLSGKILTGCAAFVVLNEEGWIITAAHVLNDISKALKDRVDYDAYKLAHDSLVSDISLSNKKKRKKLAQLQVNPDWIVNDSFWWGKDGLRLKEFVADPVADIAICRLDGFKPDMVTKYPVFKSPESEFDIGEPLCKFGFPFHKIDASFDEVANTFKLAEGAVPVPRFPIEGIHTRVAIITDETVGRSAKFIETSSPGLRGQSGGPIFDSRGQVWAIQSQTRHLPLGFEVKLQRGNENIVEHQVLNVGLGSHVEEVVRLCKSKGINIRIAEPSVERNTLESKGV